MVAARRTKESLEALLGHLNPIVAGWSNYYRHATGAWKDFNTLNRWLWFRVQGWLRKKHRKTTSHEIRRRYRRQDNRGGRSWGEGKTVLKRFAGGPVAEYRRRGVRISNGWNDEIDGVQMLWHRNGRPLRQMEFKHGRRDGRFISWNEQGEKLSELIYRNDMLVRSIE